MITQEDLEELFVWAKNSNFPMKLGPTAKGYANKPITFCWLKSIFTNTIIRKNLMTDRIRKIHENNDILFSMIVSFDSNTQLGPHLDPNLYQKPYKRIQIPLEIPDKKLCYMIWKRKKIHWVEGEPQVFEVMDYIHEGYNHSNKPMKFLFLDVKKDSEVHI